MSRCKRRRLIAVRVKEAEFVTVRTDNNDILRSGEGRTDTAYERLQKKSLG